MADVYVWTAEDVKATADEMGYDPEKFAAYLNEFEEITGAYALMRREQEKKNLQQLVEVAGKYGIDGAQTLWQNQLDQMLKWEAWRADPKPGTYPGFQ